MESKNFVSIYLSFRGFKSIDFYQFVYLVHFIGVFFNLFVHWCTLKH